MADMYVYLTCPCCAACALAWSSLVGPHLAAEASLWDAPVLQSEVRTAEETDEVGLHDSFLEVVHGGDVEWAFESDGVEPEPGELVQEGEGLAAVPLLRTSSQKLHALGWLANLGQRPAAVPSSGPAAGARRAKRRGRAPRAEQQLEVKKAAGDAERGHGWPAALLRGRLRRGMPVLVSAVIMLAMLLARPPGTGSLEGPMPAAAVVSEWDSPERKWDTLFHEADTDASGRLEQHEVKQWAKEVFGVRSSKEARSFMEYVDKDNDGTVSLPELKASFALVEDGDDFYLEPA